MKKPFTMDSFEEMRNEYSEYKGKEIGLDSQKGIFYGVIESEDISNVYLNPHLAYNPLPLPDGNFIQNLQKRDNTKKIPKSTLTKLVHEYPDGYLEKLIEMTNSRDNHLINLHNQNNTPKENKIIISKR